MFIKLLTSQNTKGNNDFAFAPVLEKIILPNPISCVTDVRKILNYVDAVKQFQLKIIKKECCIVLLGLSKNYFGFLFLM